MKSLIIAALLICTPMTALAEAPTNHIKVEHVTAPNVQDTNNIADACTAIVAKTTTPQEVVDALNLNTTAKQQNFINMCSVYFQGIQDGIAIEDSKNAPQGPTT